eukprot:9269476-Pyramimonas_sp.AAC.1
MLDHCVEDGRGDRTVTEVVDFAKQMQRRFTNTHVKIVLGVDSNCTLLPSLDGFTGSFAARPAK